MSTRKHFFEKSLFNKVMGTVNQNRFEFVETCSYVFNLTKEKKMFRNKNSGFIIYLSIIFYTQSRVVWVF